MIVFQMKWSLRKGVSVMAEKNERLNEFVIDWNRSHRNFFFTIQWAPVIARPIGVALRYAATRYRDLQTMNDWEIFKSMTDIKSHGLMLVVSGEEAYGQGIVQFAVASANHNYSEHFIVSTLEWIGKEFFGEK